MFEIYKFSEPQILAMIIVLLRMTSFIVTMPVIGSEQVPAHLKVLLSLVFTILIFPTIPWQKSGIETYGHELVFVAMKEVTIGIILGFIARLFFFMISITGEVISVAIGLSSEQLFNPAVGGRSTAIQQFQVLMGTLLFFSLNGHYYLLTAIAQSFTIIPISLEGLKFLNPAQIAHIAQETVWVGVRIAAPVMTAIFFMNIVMGIMGRAVPQINVLITSMPLNALVGFAVVIATIPMMVFGMDGLIELTATRLFQVMKEL
jgi:flagellar biosynthetic protein FliR